MGDGVDTDRGDAPVVVVAVSPALLASTLQRLLAARGWCAVGPEAPADAGRHPVAAIVSQGAGTDLRVGAPTVVVLPDEADRGGKVLCRDRPERPFCFEPGGVEGLITVLAGD